MLIKIADPVSFRSNINKKLNKLIRKKKLTVNLEKGIYNFAIQSAKERNVVRKWDNPYFVTIYIDKFRSIYNNLNKKGSVGNITLLKRLKGGEFPPHELAFMKHHQMCPEKWDELIAAKIENLTFFLRFYFLFLYYTHILQALISIKNSKKSKQILFF